jgi:hypothetical protein
MGLNRKTVNCSFGIVRTLIHAHQTEEKARFVGVVEVDESFFDPARAGDDRAQKAGPSNAQAAGVRAL